MLVAVETSDIVASTTLSPPLQNEVITKLKQRLQMIESDKLGKFEIFRGDAYQVLFFDAQCALRQSLLTKLYLQTQLSHAISVTQSLAVGELSAPVKKIGEHMDTVFVDSGRQLETLSSAYLGVHQFGFSDDFLLAIAFMNRFLAQLTSKQAEVLYWFIALNYPEQKIIAQRLSMTRQNVTTHLQRANTELFKATLEHYENNIKRQLT